jgi:hypothetical protein
MARCCRVSFYLCLLPSDLHYIRYRSQNNPLQNHIATISAYYRACIASNTHTTSDAADREIYLYSDFTHYIVASCWRKMYRRIIHWSSLGFLHNLRNVDEQWLRTMFKCHSAELPRSSRRDNALWNELHALQSEGMLREVMDFHPTKSTPEPTRLIAALWEVKEAPGEVMGLGAYTEETCFDLHQLLIAALFGFGHALKMLRDNRGLPCMERVTYIQMVAQFGNLLWRIVYSRILGHHLTLLQLGSVLSIHDRDGEDLFREYASFAPQFKRRRRTGRPTDFEERLALNIDSDEVSVSGNDRETEAIEEDEEDYEVEVENVSETEEEQRDDDEDMGEELQRMIDEVLTKKLDNNKDAKKQMGDNTMTGMGLLFQRWLRLLVNHWAALDIISSHASKSSHDIRIRLITARHPDTYADQGMKMNHWQDTIRRLSTYVTSHPQSLDPADTFNAEVCISMLETHLKDPKAPRHAHKTALNYEPENPNKFTGNYHCEALLAAIIHSGVHAPEESERFLGEVCRCLLTKSHTTAVDLILLQNWNRHIIAVSKLCCLVCWDVLAILRVLSGNSEDFVVRGRHTALFAVDLPHWLPESVVAKMVGLYRNRLLKELVTMTKRKRTYSDTPSLQSDGAFSLPSNESVDDPPRRRWWRVVRQ